MCNACAESSAATASTASSTSTTEPPLEVGSSISGSAAGTVVEDTLRFSETFSTAGATTDWVIVRTDKKLHVTFGAHAGGLDYTPDAKPPPAPKPLGPVGKPGGH